ncbi:MAG: alpha/beta fold hydrolase [Bacteroidota bacterium]|nr:alpha/beta fold hydrolase [Bacteroidota bacterium]
MKLYYKKIGEGFPIVIVHGLYGSSDNWMVIAKELSEDFEVYVLDLRNHGKSPHSDDFSIGFMVDDLLQFFEETKIQKAFLLGHSLGGKIAMEFTYKYPKFIEKLVVVDIAPRNYLDTEFVERSNHQTIINFLKNVDLSKYKNRGEALEALGKIDETGRLKLFMMKNIKREKNRKLVWKINLKAIADNLSKLLNEFDVNIAEILVATMFVKGENSNYITEKDISDILQKKSDTKFVEIKGASHWLHAEKPEEFLNYVKSFLMN